MTALPIEPSPGFCSPESPSPELVVRLPARRLTLEEVAKLAAGDEIHRYELAEGTLVVMPPADVEHAALTMRIGAWLIANGYPADRVLANPGVRTDGPNSGRMPDIAVIRHPARRGMIWLEPAQVRLVVEIVSPGSQVIDRAIKPIEYARARIAHYWRVEPTDASTTVHRYTLGLDEEGLPTYLGHQATLLEELLAGDPPSLG